MKCTQWRSWQALWPHIAGSSSSTAVSAWPNPPSVHEMASEWVSLEPTTHGEQFELHGWIPNQCCELSSVPVNHLKRTCSIVDKKCFSSRWRNNKRCQKEELTVLASCYCGTLAHGIQCEMVLFSFLMTTEGNNKPDGSVRMLTMASHPWDSVDFFFDITLVASLLCVNQIHVTEDKICWFDMLCEKRLTVKFLSMMADEQCEQSVHLSASVCQLELVYKNKKENLKSLICVTQCFLRPDCSHGRKLDRFNSTGGWNCDLPSAPFTVWSDRLIPWCTAVAK